MVELRQNLKLTQQLLMTPQLQQAIKLLQLSRIELEQFVSTQLAENPVLEEGVHVSKEEAYQVEKEREKTEEAALSERMEQADPLVDRVEGQNSEVDWEVLSKLRESTYQPPSSTRNSSDDSFPNYENMYSRTKTLQECLMEQVGELNFDDVEKRVAQIIVGNINSKGYLTVSIEEISGFGEGFDEELVEGVLDTIQRLDPPGIAARDLKECLLIQIRQRHLRNGIVEKIVESHLTSLETRNFPLIAKQLRIPIEKVIENVQIIEDLEPVPGRPFDTDGTYYVEPDVYVFKMGGKWVVTMNQDGLPELKINSYYQSKLDEKKGESKRNKKQETSKESGAGDYIQDKVKSAMWLIRSIEQRQRTIFRVMETIVKKQEDFFEKGVHFLKPMILKDIAEEIEMHESTISRVTNNKYAHTPRGIFELKYFFSSAVSSSGGDNVASESVRRMIQDLVKKEDPKKPLSDEKMAKMLKEEGIELARRTVAKYREQLGILPSSKRKRHY